MNFLIKKCEVCDKSFEKPYYCGLPEWEKAKFCGRKCYYRSKKGHIPWNKGTKGVMIPWNKGKKLHYKIWNKDTKGLQTAWNKGNGEYAKKLGFGKWMTGKKQNIESRKKNSEAMKKRVREGKHNFYIDGRTPENHRIRHSLEYKLWRESVFKRDNYTCQWCGARSGNGKRVTLNADHIKPFAYYPELRLEITNGRTLCIDCHKKTDTYMGRALNYHPSSLRRTYL